MLGLIRLCYIVILWLRALKCYVYCVRSGSSEEQQVKQEQDKEYTKRILQKKKTRNNKIRNKYKRNTKMIKRKRNLGAR